MNILTKRICLSVLFSIWLVSFLLTVPLIKYNKYSIDQVLEQNYTTQLDGMVDETIRYVEYCYNDRSSPLAKIYVSAFPALVLLVPAFTLTILYVVIIKKLKQHNEGVYEYDQPSRQDAATNQTSEPDTTETTTAAMPRQSRAGFSRLSVRFALKKNSSASSGGGGDVSSTAGSRLLGRKQTHERISIKMSHDQSLVAKRNQTITLCLVSLAFFFCQMPIKAFQIFNSFYVFDNTSFTFFRVMNVIFFLSKFLFFLHGMSNPIM